MDSEQVGRIVGLAIIILCAWAVLYLFIQIVRYLGGC
jgi:hypothetical protein